MENLKINNEIADLWKKQFIGDVQVLGPIFYGKFNKNCILFVGCNPSFSAKGFKKILENTKYEKIDPGSFLRWRRISSNLEHNINECISIEKIAIEKYDFFRPLRDIASTLGLPFQHADLFLYRERFQNKFLKSIFKKGKINEFGLKQIDIFRKIVYKTQPKVVVVANASVSKIIKNQLKNLISEFDEKEGFNWLLLEKNKRVPIFFSSMITGQRALDIYSRERLIWHIKRSLKASK